MNDNSTNPQSATSARAAWKNWKNWAIAAATLLGLGISTLTVVDYLGANKVNETIANFPLEEQPMLERSYSEGIIRMPLVERIGIKAGILLDSSNLSAMMKSTVELREQSCETGAFKGLAQVVGLSSINGMLAQRSDLSDAQKTLAKRALSEAITSDCAAIASTSTPSKPMKEVALQVESPSPSPVPSPAPSPVPSPVATSELSTLSKPENDLLYDLSQALQPAERTRLSSREKLMIGRQVCDWLRAGADYWSIRTKFDAQYRGAIAGDYAFNREVYIRFATERLAPDYTNTLNPPAVAAQPEAQPQPAPSAPSSSSSQYGRSIDNYNYSSNQGGNSWVANQQAPQRTDWAPKQQPALPYPFPLGNSYPPVPIVQ
jgi:hypothetical protein